MKKGDIINFGVYPYEESNIDLTSFEEVRENVFKSPSGELYYGTYPEFDNEKKKTSLLKPIEWEVVSVQGDYALLLSLNIIDCRKFDKNNSCVYQHSSVRKYLNNTFVNFAFSNAELKIIQKCDITGTLSVIDNASASENTDRVFILSFDDLVNIGTFMLEKDSKLVRYSYAGYENSYMTRTAKNNKIVYIAMSWSGNGHQFRTVEPGEISVGIAPAIWIKND